MNPLLKLLHFYITPYTLYWGAAVAGIVNLIGSEQQRKTSKQMTRESLGEQRRQYETARGDLAPYREFGEGKIGELSDWLQTPEGQFRAPTMEDVQAGQGYQTRLGAVEGSAAARGSLFSGNALRDIGEFGASEYEREYGRRQGEFQNELAKRMQLANFGYGAAGGSAGIAQQFGQQQAQTRMAGLAPQLQAIQSATSGIGSAAGAYQGQQNWNDFLARMDTSDSGGDDDDSGDMGW